jgi:antitoxin HicB
MFIATYPASFLPEDDKGFHVRFPDFPEALTGGDDLEDTQVQAADCLAEAIAGPKLALYLAMRERSIPNTELAKRLGVSETVVRRMLNPKHDTKRKGFKLRWLRSASAS